MVAEEQLNAFPGLSRTVPTTKLSFAVFVQKPTLKLGGRYGKGGY